MILFGHTADCHVATKYLEDSLSSLRQIRDICFKKELKFLIIAGDFWDDMVYVVKNSPLVQACDILKEIADKLPIILIYGNHDKPGSLEILEQISSNITVVEGNGLYCMVGRKIMKYEEGLKPDLAFLCFSYPRDEYVAKRIREEKLKITDDAGNKIESFIRYEKQKMLDRLKKFPNIPKIAIAHGTMIDSQMDIGQDQSTLTSETHFRQATFDGCDYVALGHIHKYQVFKNGGKQNIVYPSSIYSCNFSEVEPKSFSVVELEKDEPVKNYKFKIKCKLRARMDEDMDKWPKTRGKIQEKIIELNDRLSKDTYTLWEVNFTGPKSMLKFITEFNFAPNITPKIYSTDNVLTRSLQESPGEELTDDQKIRRFVEINEGVKWTTSLEAKLNKIKDKVTMRYKSGGGDS